MEPDTLAYDGDQEAWNTWQVPVPRPLPPVFTMSSLTAPATAEVKEVPVASADQEKAVFADDAIADTAPDTQEDVALAPTLAYEDAEAAPTVSDEGVEPTLAYDTCVAAAASARPASSNGASPRIQPAAPPNVANGYFSTGVAAPDAFVDGQADNLAGVATQVYPETQFCAPAACAATLAYGETQIDISEHTTGVACSSPRTSVHAQAVPSGMEAVHDAVQAANPRRAEANGSTSSVRQDRTPAAVPAGREAPGLDASASAIAPGCSVRLHGLQAMPELNGMDGICTQWDHERERWVISLTNGEERALRPGNLQVISAAPEPAPGASHSPAVAQRGRPSESTRRLRLRGKQSPPFGVASALAGSRIRTASGGNPSSRRQSAPAAPAAPESAARRRASSPCSRTGWT
eukprot:TRINITY_DN28886_c0_g1_i2.p1 TRINITY_DN28886_c0_g1~~TRINITY_DN28886_c0_g1_i2.p1  ORF type:complete len:406 (-),score=42.67 TRINITY_DN28886_c0_g1_i2:95-1312(-)